MLQNFTSLFIFLRLGKNTTDLSRGRQLLLEHYIYREMAQKLIWILGLLLLIFTSNKFVGFLADAAAGKLPGDMIFMMLGYKVLASLPKILPVSLLVAILLTFGRMTRDRELVILSAAGMGTRFQIAATLRFTAVYSVLVAIICIYLSPLAEARIHLLKEQAKQESDISGITAGRFKEFTEGERVVYVETLSDDKRAMENVFLHVRQDGKLGVLKSESARFKFDKQSGHRYIAFEKGRRYVGEPGMLDYRVTEYDTYAVLVERSETENLGAKTSSIPFTELWQQDHPVYSAEIHWRLSLILSCILLALFAVMLNQFILGERRLAPFALAILVYLIYSNLLGIGMTLIRRDIVSSFIGLWWVHLLLIIVIVVLYYFPTIRHWNRNDNKQQILPAE